MRAELSGALNRSRAILPIQALEKVQFQVSESRSLRHRSDCSEIASAAFRGLRGPDYSTSASSKRSAERESRNSTAMPPWKWRTTFPGVLPKVALVPIASFFFSSIETAVAEPGQLGGELVPLADGRGDRHGKALACVPRDLAFHPPDMFEVEHDPLADRALDRCDERDAAGRHVDGLAGVFLAVGEHVAAEQRQPHPVVPPALELARARRGNSGLHRAIDC